MKLSLYIVAIALQFLGHPDYNGGEVVRNTRESGPLKGELHGKGNIQKIITR
jgi:hypothetical protein